jgi:hypothetical protein
MKQTLSILGTVGVLFGCSACLADDFAFEVVSPKFKVNIPNIPQLKMGPHPMNLNGSAPHLRFLGSEGPYTVTIITPTADAGMTAVECASSKIRTLSSRPGGPPSSQVYRAKINENTYVAIYAAPLGSVLQLHAHFLSAAGGTHCIEVHASKVSMSKDDLDPWFKGFGTANIDPN